jgi:phage shock protein PspC (stress-responsive transcriptional regulator)
MKKIININLSGRVIPIEDSAYESLQRYIDSLRRYFAHEDGRDEIINDIESRIAELMNDKVKKGAAAVTEADIEEIITAMGRVSDFEAVDAAEGGTTGAESATGGTYTESTGATTGAKRFRGRLYRDSSDKLLGGVCAGIANYMNVDPAIIRLLFAIITFGGFGFGVFLYILAWIILPARDLEGFVGKRLFRNPEDKVLGGVAGGLAAYFNKEAWVIRLIFAAPLLLNILLSVLNGVFNAFDHHYGPDIFFGSFTGTFILAYIILWIVLPEARSPFEKMEMRGEKVDVNRIRQNVQEGMSSFSSKAQAWGEEVRESAERLGTRASEFANTRGKTFASEVSQTTRPVASGLGHAIGVLFKAFFLFIFGSIAFALFVVVLVFTLGGIAQPFKDFMLNGFWQTASLWGTLIFFLAVPLIAIITWMVRRLMKVRSQNRYLGWVFGGLWTLGWISLALFIATMGRDWSTTNSAEQQIALSQPALNKMTVRIDEPKIRYSGTFDWINDDSRDGSGWDVTNDSLLLSNVKIRVSKSPDALYHVSLIKYSQGNNRNEARNRAEKVNYSVSSLDSALVIGSGFAVGKSEKFRGQRVIVEIKVPAGKMIRFDETVSKLEYTNIRVYQRNRGSWRNRNWEVEWDDDNYHDWEPGIDYVMTEDGRLVNAALPVTTPSTPTTEGTYEYRSGAGTSTSNDSLRRINDSLRRVREESERQIQENERRMREGSGAVRPRNSHKSDNLAHISPIFSFVI